MIENINDVFLVTGTDLTRIADRLRTYSKNYKGDYAFPTTYLEAIEDMQAHGTGGYRNPVMVYYATDDERPVGSTERSMETYRQLCEREQVSVNSLYIFKGETTTEFVKDMVYMLVYGDSSVFSPDTSCDNYIVWKSGGVYYITWYNAANAYFAANYSNGMTYLNFINNTVPIHVSPSYSSLEDLWAHVANHEVIYSPVNSWTYAYATGSSIDISSDTELLQYHNQRLTQYVVAYNNGTSTFQNVPSVRGALNYHFIELYSPDADIVEFGQFYPSTLRTYHTPSPGKIGFNQIVIEPVTYNIDPNISANNIKNGISILGITGTYSGEPPVLQQKYVAPTTSTQTVVFDSGYDGLSSVTVYPIQTLPLTVNSSTVDQSYTPPEGRYYSSVTVNRITSQYLTAENIKHDITLFGVTGSYYGDAIDTQTVYLTDTAQHTIYPHTYAQINPAGITNLTAANIKAGVSILGITGTYRGPTITTDTRAITNTNLTLVETYMWARVVDANLTAGNIRNGVSILGITGTYVGSVSGSIPITTTAPVNVSAYASAYVSDSNLIASNIKSGVSILGITGTFEQTVYHPDTSDATAIAADLRSGKTAYVDGNKITGSMATYAAPSTWDIDLSSAHVSLTIPTAQKYCPSDITVSGIVASQLVVLGSEIPATVIPVPGSGVGLGSVTFSINSSVIKSEYIVRGCRILGIDGSYDGIIPTETLTISRNGTFDVANCAQVDVHVAAGDTSDANAEAATILAGYTAYANNNYITGTIPTYNTFSYNLALTPTGGSLTLPTSGYYVPTNIEITAEAIPYTVNLGTTMPTNLVPVEGVGIGSVTFTLDTNAVKSEYIARGYSILGVEGSFIGSGLIPEDRTITLDFSTSDIVTITSTDNDHILNSVIINKPITLIPENIRAHTVIDGIEGTLIVPSGSYPIIVNGDYDISAYASVSVNVPSIDPSDATAIAADILAGKTAYINTGKVVGTLETYSGSTEITMTEASYLLNSRDKYFASSVQITAPLQAYTYTLSDAAFPVNGIVPGTGYIGLSSVQFNTEYLRPGMIKEGITILGVTGTVHEGITPSGSITITENGENINVANLASINVAVLDIDTWDATVTSASMLSGVIGYGCGNRYVGTIPIYTEASFSLNAPTATITTDGYYFSGNATVSAVLQNKNIVANGTYSASSGYAGLGQVTVDVQPNLQSKTNIAPATTAQLISADSGYDGLSSVQINAVTAAIDSNIIAGNIKSGVTILGITGNYSLTTQAVTVTPITSTQIINPEAGYDALSQVTVNRIPVEYVIPANSLTLTQTGSIAVYDPIQHSAYASVYIDPTNFVSSNIRAGVTLLGITGSPSVVDTSDADATALQIAGGKTAYVNGSKITGTMRSFIGSAYTLTSASLVIPTQDYYLDHDLTVYGDVENVTFTSNGTYTSSGHMGYGQVTVSVSVNNEILNITPSTVSQSFTTPSVGYDGFLPVTVAAVTAAIDSNIIADNIKSGITILGITGTYSGVDTTDATAVAADILIGKTAYARGSKITGTCPIYSGALRS